MFVLYIESSVRIITNYDYSAIVSFDSDGTYRFYTGIFMQSFLIVSSCK